MPRIRGKFAPMYSELFDDERFLVKLTDFQKLIYMLLLYTAYMNENKCPKSAAYYASRYNLTNSMERHLDDTNTTPERHLNDTITTPNRQERDTLTTRIRRAIDRVTTVFP